MAKFYENLDSRVRLEDICDHADDDENTEDDEQDKHIAEFTVKELSNAIGSFRKGKSADN